MKVRNEIISNKWLKGAISMPSNIFANTGTNVSIIIIDKSQENEQVILMDASSLGEKYKDGKNQKTKLSHDELTKIVSSFVNMIEEPNFSIIVSNEDICNKKFSFSAGQYFKIEIKYNEYTNEEFEQEVNRLNENISKLVAKNDELFKNMKNNMSKVKYYESNKN